MEISAKTSSKETPPRRCAATTYTSRSEVTSIRRHPIVLFYGCRILFFDPQVECGCHHVTEPKSPIWEISQFPNNFGIFSGTLAVSFRGGNIPTPKRWHENTISEVMVNQGLGHTDAGRSTTACLRHTVRGTLF